MPTQVKSWLRETGSLTQRIKQTFAGNFSVELKGEAIDKPFKQDQACVGEVSFQRAFIREVVLKVNAIPYVFARTTVPISSLRGLQKLSKLGTRPLGEVIFSYPDLKREQLDFAKLKRSQLSAEALLLIGSSATIWARRNTYVINGNRLIVCEFFVSNMFEGFYENTLK